MSYGRRIGARLVSRDKGVGLTVAEASAPARFVAAKMPVHLVTAELSLEKCMREKKVMLVSRRRSCAEVP